MFLVSHFRGFPCVPFVTGDVASGRKRTRLESDERRKQILDAAIEVLSTRPYSEVSMSDLVLQEG